MSEKKIEVVKGAGEVVIAALSNIRTDWNQSDFGDALSFYGSDSPIFSSKNGAVLSDADRVAVQITYAKDTDSGMVAWSVDALDEDGGLTTQSGSAEGGEAEESAGDALKDILAQYLDMSEDGISDAVYAIQNSGSLDFGDDFDDAKDCEWVFLVGDGDRIEVSEFDAAGGVLLEIYPPVQMEWELNEDGMMDYDSEAHQEGRNESDRFIGVCLS